MKLGLSCEKVTGMYGYKEGLKLIKESGFDSVDISFTEFGSSENDLYCASEDEFLTYFHNIKKRCDELELEISQTHGRLTTCVPEQKKTELRSRKNKFLLFSKPN